MASDKDFSGVDPLSQDGSGTGVRLDPTFEISSPAAITREVAAL